MFTKAKSLRVVLLIVLAASVLTAGSAPASAVPQDYFYDCNTGIRSEGANTYFISGGFVTLGSSCSGAVLLPNGVTGIGNNAFKNAVSLSSITIPSTVTSIEGSAFESSTLETITFQGTSELLSIGEKAFQRAAALGSISIPNSVTSIGVYAFAYTTLISITIPNSVTSIGDYAFLKATALTSISIPNSVTSIGVAAFAFTSPTSMTIPNSVTTISESAFSHTTSLTSISIPNSVTSIGDYAFQGSGLPSITIPNSVISIGNGAFYGATSLTSITIPNSVTSIGNNAFYNTTSLMQYTYCGTSLTQTVLDTAGLSGKTKNCAPVYVPPMLPGTKPTVTISDTLITCTIGTYSATPTSSAFSLFVDGKHTSTIFSALGEYLPDWIIPWATSSTITRTATLTSATWAMSDAFKGKSITCATLAYSRNAIGFTASQVMVAK